MENVERTAITTGKRYNPANDAKDTMWAMLMTFGQKSNIPALRDAVYDLIQMTTQKTGGQPQYAKRGDINWENLDMTMMTIVIEATALVLSGDLEKLEDLLEKERKQQNG